MLYCLLLEAAVLMGQGQSQPKAAAGVPREQVERLVRRLDAAQLAQREAAERELLDLGPGILDLLPGPAANVSAEVQQRLGRIRQVLKRRASESVAEASRVTLHAESLPLGKVLAEISRQTGNALHDHRARLGQPQEDPKVSVRFEKTPFWKALDEVLDQANLDVDPYGDRRAVVIVANTSPGARRSGRAAYSGPFRIEPTAVEARRSLRNPAAAALRLSLQVSWEPRARPIAIKQRLADLAAIDQNGRGLDTGGDEVELEAAIQATDTTKELQVSIPLPPREVRQIAKLNGRLTAMLPGHEETFRFDGLSKAANDSKQVAGATVVLEAVRRNHDLWEVRILVRFDRAGGALESHRGWIFQNEARLEGPQGKQVRPSTVETTRRTESEVGLAYLFEAPGSLEGYTFVYRTPVSVVSAGFDYRLGPIELP